MFESLQVNSRRSLGARLLALLVSFFFHGLMIAVLIILPLAFLNALPEHDLLTILIAAPVPPPPPSPPAPRPPESVPKAARPKTIPTDWDAPPDRLPRGLPAPNEAPPAIAIMSGSEGVGSGLVGPANIAASGIHSGLLDPVAPPVALPPLPAAPKKTPVKIGGAVQEAKLIRKVMPEYPQLALKSHVSGEVRLEILVNEEGDVIDVKVIQGNPLLIAEAVRAVWQWKYSPTLLNGEPVIVNSSVTVVFQLKR